MTYTSVTSRMRSSLATSYEFFMKYTSPYTFIYPKNHIPRSDASPKARNLSCNTSPRARKPRSTAKRRPRNRRYIGMQVHHATRNTPNSASEVIITPLITPKPPRQQIPYEILNTPSAICQFVDQIKLLPTTPPSLYIDLEGVNLSREGSISILQIYVAPHDKAYLVDVHLLQRVAFETAGVFQRTLRDVLEDPGVPKVIFDVRSDSDALFAHFGVRLAGIWDLQLMELATRREGRRRTHITGLAKCIQYDAGLSSEEGLTFKASKDNGRRLFAPELGGSYEVFNTRPMAKEIIDYCVEDVRILPKLWAMYDSKLTDLWMVYLKQATEQRIAQSQSPSYAGKGQHMMLAPVGWDQLDGKGMVL